MTKPIRMLDDPDTLEALRGDLSALRDAAAPDFDEEAGLRRLEQAIAAGAAAGVGAELAASGAAKGAGTAATTAKVSSGLAVKGIFGWIAAGTAAVALTYGAATQLEEPTPADPVETAATVPTAVPTEPGPISPEAPPEASLPAKPLAEVADIAPTTPPSTPTAVAKALSAEPSDASAKAAEEMAWMAELRKAGSPQAALAKADEGQARFAGGLFYPERELIAIQSLAQLGRASEARARGEAFLAAYPHSPLADAVRQAANL